jgi:UDP-N-acetylmuramoylalanine--D-glutamate ligase
MRDRVGTVEVVDVAASDPQRHAQLLEGLPDGCLLRPPSHYDSAALADLDLVIASPGWRLDDPFLRAAAAAGTAVWGELDLAWVLQAQGRRPDTVWLPLTGTNGKTTTVRMLESMLRATGRSALAVGNVGTPIVDAVCADDPPELLALEVSSLQLSRSTVMRPLASAALNLAPDHLDWHDGWDRYFAAKAQVFSRTSAACIYNLADASTQRMVEQADVVDGCRAIGVTLLAPSPGQLGVVDDLLVDRAFLDERGTHAIELATFDDITPFAPHNVSNALFAAALARAAGAAPEHIAAGLRDFVAEPHRIADAGTVEGVRYVDDSKATNPHAAQSSLRAFDQIVWIAGGLAKGVTFDDLVAAVADRLAGVVLIGDDRAVIAEALARHAPEVPVVDADDADTDPMSLMRAVVAAARGLATPGGTVLLAPACASMDRFRDYHERGELFAAAVQELRA